MASPNPTGSGQNPHLQSGTMAELRAEDVTSPIEMPDNHSPLQHSTATTLVPAAVEAPFSSFAAELPTNISESSSAAAVASQDARNMSVSEKDALALTGPEQRTAPMPSGPSSMGLGLDFGSNSGLGLDFGSNSGLGLAFGSNSGLGFGSLPASNSGFAMSGNSSTGPSHGAASAGMGYGLEMNNMGYGANSGFGFGASSGSNTGFAMAGNSSSGPSHGPASAGMAISSDSKGTDYNPNTGIGFGSNFGSNTGIGFGSDYGSYTGLGFGSNTGGMGMGFGPSNTTPNTSRGLGIGLGSNTTTPTTTTTTTTTTGLGYGSNISLGYTPSTTPLPNTTIPAPVSLQLSNLPTSPSSSHLNPGHHDLPIHPSDPIPDAAYPLNDFSLARDPLPHSHGPPNVLSPFLHRNPSAASHDQITSAPLSTIQHSDATRKIDHLAMPGSGLPLHATPQSASAGASSAGPSSSHGQPTLNVYSEPPPPYEPSDAHSRPNTSATAVSRSTSVDSTAPLQPSATTSSIAPARSTSTRAADPSTTLPLVHLNHPPQAQLARQQQQQRGAYGERPLNRPWSAAYWINPSGGASGKKKGWKKRKRYWICMAVVLFVIGLSTGLAVSMSNWGPPKNDIGNNGNNGGNAGQGNSGNPLNP